MERMCEELSRGEEEKCLEDRSLESCCASGSEASPSDSLCCMVLLVEFALRQA